MKYSIVLAVFAMLLSTIANAAPITLNFDTINGSANYSESGFTLVGPLGNHTDGSNVVYFHEFGANSVTPNNLVLSQGGVAFDFLSLDVIFAALTSPLTITSSNGDLATITANGIAVLNWYNVTSVTLSPPANGSTVGFDNVVVDPVATLAEVPEPASIALWSLVSVAGIAAWRRRKRGIVS